MNESGQIDITLGLFDNRYEMISWYTLSIAANSSFHACWGGTLFMVAIPSIRGAIPSIRVGVGRGEGELKLRATERSGL